MKNICLVCCYDDFDKLPYLYENGEIVNWSHEICPCCGFQFGLSDFPYEERDELIAKWRKKWIANGCIWKHGSPPDSWDPQKQLESLNK
jgi:hypothetical protein